ncbi:MAG: ArsR/SmtB family transcription factor [Myxococcota bacterium]
MTTVRPTEEFKVETTLHDGQCTSPCPPPTPPEPVDLERFNDELARLAKAIAHPARVAILRILLARERCVCGEIVAELPLAQSTVSQHLKLMKEAGLVRGTVEGPRVCYCVEPAAVQRLRDLISKL